MTTTYNTIQNARAETAVTILFLAGALFVFLFSAFLNIGKPFSSDEHWFVIAAHDYAVSGVLSP